MAPRANSQQRLRRGDWTGGTVVLFTAADLPSRLTGDNLAAAAAAPLFQPCSEKAGHKNKAAFYDPGGEKPSLECLLLGV